MEIETEIRVLQRNQIKSSEEKTFKKEISIIGVSIANEN